MEFSEKRYAMHSKHFYFLAAVIAAIFLTLTILGALYSEQHNQRKVNLVIGKETHILSQDFSTEISNSMRGLHDAVSLWQEEKLSPAQWKASAEHYLEHDPSLLLIEFVNHARETNWIVYGKNSGLEVSGQPQANQGINKLSSGLSKLYSDEKQFVNLGSSGAAFFVYLPIEDQNSFRGFVAGKFRIDKLVAPVADKALFSGYQLFLNKDQNTIYVSSSFKPHASEHMLCKTSKIDVHNEVWNLTLCPTIQKAEHLMSPMPWFILSFGVLLTLFITLFLIMLGRSRGHWLILKEQKLNDDLMYRIVVSLKLKNNIKDTLKEILSDISKSKGWAVGHIYEKSMSGKEELSPLGVWYVMPGLEISEFQEVTEQKPFKRGEGLPGRVWETEQVVTIQNIHKDKNFPRAKLCKELNLKGAIAFPITYQGEVIYVFEFFAPGVRTPSKREINTFEYISEIISRLWRTFAVEQKLSASEERQRLVLNSVKEGIYGVDLEGRATFVNPAAEQMLGYEDTELLEKNMHLVIHHSHENGESYDSHDCPIYSAFTDGKIHRVSDEVFWRKDGTFFYVEYTSTPMRKRGKLVGAVVTFRDISDQRTSRKALEKLALYDHLTDLYNRIEFEKIIKLALSDAELKQKKLALLSIDLDNFKIVNDRYGHNSGDQILKQFSHLLQNIFTKNEKIGRLGGDEFAVLIDDVVHASDVKRLTQQLVENVNEKVFKISGVNIQVQVSVGVAASPYTGRTVEEFLRNADIALQKTKKLDIGSYQFYTPELYQEYTRTLMLEMDLKQAILQNEFYLVFQPQFLMPEKKMVGFEVLVRWRHPELGEISPAEFIPIAELSNQISAIDLWIIEHACEKYNDIFKNIENKPKISINLSAHCIDDEEYITAIKKILSKSGIPPHCIGLEITETSLATVMAKGIQYLSELRNLGYEIIIDDFGVDYSSFSRLRDLPVTTLKIDAIFIKNILTNTTDAIIVKSLIRLAKELNFKVIAEGVEEEEQLEFVLRNGCSIIQGFFLSRPLSETNFRVLAAKSDGVAS